MNQELFLGVHSHVRLYIERALLVEWERGWGQGGGFSMGKKW